MGSGMLVDPTVANIQTPLSAALLQDATGSRGPETLMTFAGWPANGRRVQRTLPRQRRLERTAWARADTKRERGQ